MNNDSKELKELLQSVAPESWDERVDEALEVYDRYREVADAMERAERALADAEPPDRIEIVSTKGWKITDEMIDNLPFKSTKGLTLDND